METLVMTFLGVGVLLALAIWLTIAWVCVRFTQFEERQGNIERRLDIHAVALQNQEELNEQTIRSN